MTSSTTGEIVVGKGKLTLTDAVKRELYNEETTIDSNDKDNDNDGEHASKKVKLSNDTTIKNEKKKDELDECWVKVGRLGFYLRHLGRMPLRNSRIIQYNNCNLIIQVRC